MKRVVLSAFFFLGCLFASAQDKAYFLNGTTRLAGSPGTIFQPFFNTKPTGKATGLGLSFTNEIVNAHGGDLKAETREYEATDLIIQFHACHD